MGLKEVFLTGYDSSFFELGFNAILFRLFVAIALILFGIFLGKIIAYSLKKLSEKVELEKNMRKSFINLLLAVIKWSIYIVFINFAIVKLGVPGLAEIISKILVVIPALTAALILIAIGFGIGYYLREVIEDSEITGWKVVSQYFFYFIVYIFGIYALKIALVSLDVFVTNIIIIVLTAIAGIAIAYTAIKKEIHHSS